MSAENDLAVLARTAYGEARGQPDVGILAVCCVACNRAVAAARYVERHGRRHPLFGDGTVASACTMPWQFSCWNANDPNLPKLLELDLAGEQAAPFVRIAGAAIAKTCPDPTMGATNYHTLMAPMDGVDWPPSWAAEMQQTTVIGAHVFYKPREPVVA
jgi:cell wall hydrolase